MYPVMNEKYYLYDTEFYHNWTLPHKKQQTTVKNFHQYKSSRTCSECQPNGKEKKISLLHETFSWWGEKK